MKIKIHCLEMLKEDFDETPLNKLKEMVGWIEAPDKDGDWDVTMSDGCGFSCKTQIEAQTLAGVEEIKAMLMRGVKLEKGEPGEEKQ